MVEKQENAGSQHFLVFPQRFFTQSKKNFAILATLELSSADAFNLSFGKDLICYLQFFHLRTVKNFTLLKMVKVEY